jgi:hypothetical protein
MLRILLAALLAVGCDSNAVNVTSHMDLAVADSNANSDLPMLDLFMCGQRRDTGVESKSVVNTLTVPMDRMEFALDLNGDSRPDNQLGNIMAALNSQNLQPQIALSAAVASGDDLLLIDVTTSSFSSDPCAVTRVQYANPQASPDFSGSGSFTVASSPAPVSLLGAIGSADFSTSEGAEPISLQILLPFATALVPVTLIDAHLTFSLSQDGTPTVGQVNGAIRESDIMGQVIPEVARQLNLQVTTNATLFDGGPPNPNNSQLLQIFDVGCTSAGLNFDGTPAEMGDGKIASCEVSQNAIIQAVLAPDVQLFDANGNFAPNPDNTSKDSLSVGVGFTAVGATF